MAQTVNVNFRMDSELKKSLEQVCDEMGLSMTTAFTIFAKKVTRERRIPFEITADSTTDLFYSKSNIEHLENVISKINNGTANLLEKDLIEVD